MKPTSVVIPMLALCLPLAFGTWSCAQTQGAERPDYNYGMGPGMMGPGRGSGYGRGPGMMGPGWGFGEGRQSNYPHVSPEQQKEQDKAFVEQYLRQHLPDYELKKKSD